MKRTVLAAAVFMASTALGHAQIRDTLDIYLIDVEGGNATLFVTPSGKSVLIDTGNVAPEAAARDAARIIDATRDAGISQIDHLITTHWHNDHFGGMAALAAQIPIAEFIDHGENTQAAELPDAFLAGTYPGLIANAAHRVVVPGDTLDIEGLDWRIVASAGEVIDAALPGTGAPNPYCEASPRQDDDPTENARSVGSIVGFGAFRTAHLGDLTWNKELDLMCPVNRIGQIDLFIVSHHGQSASNSPALVHALGARAAIMNNGTQKGGQPDTMRVLASAPGLEDLWQIHFSRLSGQEYTQAGIFIANPFDAPLEAMPIAPFALPPPGPDRPAPPAHNGEAFWIKVEARNDGSFTIINQRNGFSKNYAAE